MKWYQSPLWIFTVGLLLFAVGAMVFNWRLEVWSLTASVALGGAIGYAIIKALKARGHLLSNTIVSLP